MARRGYPPQFQRRAVDWVEGGRNGEKTPPLDQALDTGNGAGVEASIPGVALREQPGAAPTL